LLLSSPCMVKRNQQQWYNINPLLVVVQPMHGKEESTAVMTTTNSGLMLYHCCWFLFTMHGLDNKQWINVISLLLIPLYLAWAITLIHCFLLSSPCMVKRNQQQWYNINPLFVVVKSGLMLYHCCWFLFTMHGLDNNKQWINVISLLLIPLYLEWYNINPLFVVVQPMHGKEESTAVI
jgi:hypothetical protein